MFYEVNKVNDAFSCSKCNERLDEPRILPCGETICFHCAAFIQVNSSKFECVLCDQKHTMPDEGLPINKKLLVFMSIQPTEVYRSQAVETLKVTLKTIQKKLLSLSFSNNNGMDKIKEYFIELRSDSGN